MKETNYIIFILIMTILMGSSLTFASSLKKDWTLRNDFKTTKVWRNNKQNSLYVAIEKSTIKSLNEYKQVLESDSSDKERAKLLSLIQLKNWSPTSKKWIKIKGEKVYKITGTYIDASDDKTYFEEYHKIKNNTVLKSIFTSIKKNSFKDNKSIISFVREIKEGDVNE